MYIMIYQQLQFWSSFFLSVLNGLVFFLCHCWCATLAFGKSRVANSMTTVTECVDSSAFPVFRAICLPSAPLSRAPLVKGSYVNLKV